MLLRWSCLLLLCFLADFHQIQGKIFGSSQSSSSGSSRSASRPSSFSSSHSSSLGSSRPSSLGSHGSSHSSFGSSGTASHGSYGWATRSPVRPTTHKTIRYYPVTTMPTRRTSTRRYIVTTMPTHRTTRRTTRYHPITTMPTHGSTKRTTRYHPITTMPTHRHTSVTRQPPYNPYYTTPSKHNNSHTRQPPYNPFFSSSTTTRQPPYNPFYSSSTTTRRTPNNPFYNSSTTIRQPPYNPFYSSSTTTTRRTPNNPFYNSSTTIRQPPYNPYNTTPSRNNGSNWHHTTPGSLFSTKATAKPPFGHNNGTGTRPGPFYNGTGLVTPKPNPIYTTKAVTVGSGISNGRWNNSRPVTQPTVTKWTTSTPWHGYTTPKYAKPIWNNSAIHGSPGSGIYRPPGHQNNTFISRPTYITGTHNNYRPPSTGGTTIINNNNYHYHPGILSSSPTQHVTVINNHNYYNPNHHVIIPSRHYYGYGPPAVGVTIVNTDYYSHPISSHYTTTYRYSSVDTGSTALGFYLGYQLGRISRPSYYYHSTSYVNNEYVPRYDHYTIHHYYHNSASVPKEAPIQPNAIVVCPGDTTTLCPPGNMPLCTNNGAVMCVVRAQSTVPCGNNIQSNCVTSTISCNGVNTPECYQKTEASVSIPCISTANINAGVEFVNNSLIVANNGDTSTKSFCVTILASPSQSPNSTQATSKPKPPNEYSLPFHYTTNDTGVGLLGYYLGNKLKKLAQPSYTFLNYDSSYNYNEIYDHYNVFHYDHDATVLPTFVEIKAEQIMSCAGDSGTFCPQNTTSLCLYDGAVLCVAEMDSTFSSGEIQGKYIYSNISCVDLKSPACLSTPNGTIPIVIPCISTAKLMARATYMIKNYGTGSNIIYYKTLEPFINGTTVESLNSPRELCVTILAVPGEKIILKKPEVRQVTGLPNSINSLTLPKYNYNYKETGDNLFGYYLADRLNRIDFPTYYWINAYLYRATGEAQKYDHYSVHYHSHGNEILPKDLELEAAQITGCTGDSGLICPTKTSSICLNDGSVWCVTDQMLTKPCNKTGNVNDCVNAELSCLTSKSPMCKDLKVKKAILVCVVTLTVTGDITAVNNTIYKRNPQNPKSYTDIQMVPNSNSSSKAQHFCVTLVNIPIERKISEGEKVFQNSDSLFGRLVNKILGV